MRVCASMYPESANQLESILEVYFSMCDSSTHTHQWERSRCLSQQLQMVPLTMSGTYRSPTIYFPREQVCREKLSSLLLVFSKYGENMKNKSRVKHPPIQISLKFVYLYNCSRLTPKNHIFKIQDHNIATLFPPFSPNPPTFSSLLFFKICPLSPCCCVYVLLNT